MAKLKQKVSGCLRILTGVQQFCATRSYLSTVAKHGMSFFEALIAFTEGRPWMPTGPNDLGRMTWAVKTVLLSKTGPNDLGR